MELAKLISAVTVPPRETGEPPIESVEFVEFTVIEEFSSSVLLIVWPKLVRQVPPEAKHPVERLNPLLAVEVAPEVISKSPPEIVKPDEVAKNPGATRPVYKVEVGAWKLPMDCTERMEPGVVVPNPKLFPAVSTVVSAPEVL